MRPRQTGVTFSPPRERQQVAQIGGDHPGIVAFQDWLGGMTWRTIELLGRCAAEGVGAGIEAAHSMYDSESEPDVEPFVGVQIFTHYRGGESVIVSREEHDRIVADFFDFARAHPPDPLPSWWPAFLENAAAVCQRADLVR